MTYLFAHRGGRAHGADNAIPTFLEALARGVTGLETDAWVTADGAVVLDHGGAYRLDGRSRAPIARLHRNQLPDTVASLDDLYHACGTGFDLAVDVKDPHTAAAVCNVAARHQATERLWVFANDGIQLDDVRPAHAATTVSAPDLLRPGLSGRLRAARDLGAEALNARWLWWHRRAVEQVHREGLLAFGYDAQRPASLRRCARLGLDGVFSDHVDRMLAMLH